MGTCLPVFGWEDLIFQVLNLEIYQQILSGTFPFHLSLYLEGILRWHRQGRYLCPRGRLGRALGPNRPIGEPGPHRALKTTDRVPSLRKLSVPRLIQAIDGHSMFPSRLNVLNSDNLCKVSYMRFGSIYLLVYLKYTNKETLSRVNKIFVVLRGSPHTSLPTSILSLQKNLLASFFGHPPTVPLR